MDLGIGLGSGIAIYFIIWWILFFPVLATHNRDPNPEAEQVRGQERGAPARPRLRRKVGLTTLAAFVVFALFVAILNSGLSLDDVPLPSPPHLEN
ncbi:MAG: DUF1467 family protein [Pseudomonadota bacterium]